ncbi:hypothetical protein ACFW9F_01315 [Streptomyces sp. NPDC059506]|uniref:hypothetical protein n=1 Tax=Streptomyces sp. NPDC059506 TaxID=3347751 RepID=UPI0036AF4360
MSPYRPQTVAPSGPDRPTARPPGPAQVCGIVVFPVLGAALTVHGMPVGDVLGLLAGCGVIAAATTAAAGAGRALLSALANAAARAAADAEHGAR